MNIPLEQPMASLFSSKPKTTVVQEKPKPLPREDDEAARRKRLEEYAEIQKRSGRESTRLESSQEERLGDYTPAMTRGVAILGG